MYHIEKKLKIFYLNKCPLVEVLYQVVKNPKKAIHTWEEKLMSTLLIGYTLCLEAFQEEPNNTKHYSKAPSNTIETNIPSSMHHTPSPTEV
jgi:hypothetical protein